MTRNEAENLSQEIFVILEKIRLQKGITKSKIAKDTGLSRTAITLIAQKKNSPTIRTLLMIANSLNVKLSEVIKEVEDK